MTRLLTISGFTPSGCGRLRSHAETASTGCSAACSNLLPSKTKTNTNVHPCARELHYTQFYTKSGVCMSNKKLGRGKKRRRHAERGKKGCLCLARLYHSQPSPKPAALRLPPVFHKTCWVAASSRSSLVARPSRPCVPLASCQRPRQQGQDALATWGWLFLG